MSQETEGGEVVADRPRLHVVDGDGGPELTLAARARSRAVRLARAGWVRTLAATAPQRAVLAAWPARFSLGQRLAMGVLPVIPIWWAWQPFILVAIFAALGFAVVGLRVQAPPGAWLTILASSAVGAATFFQVRSDSWAGGLVAFGQGLLAGWLLLLPPGGPPTPRPPRPSRPDADPRGAQPAAALAAEPAPEPTAALPPADLLTRSAPIDQPATSEPARADLGRAIDERGQALQQLFADLEVGADVIGQVRGPAITRYEVTLQAGNKVGKVKALAEDIAYTLAAPGSGVTVALIPGRSAIGIDVGNLERTTVWLGDLLDQLPSAAPPLTVPWGIGLAGDPVIADLAEGPHWLIGGSTGSGKSTCLNVLVSTLLLRNPPDRVRLLLIDPKRVELTQYDGVPHLATPVVTHPQRAIEALAWAAEEMDRRLAELAAAGVRHISAYNAKHTSRPLPYLVVVLDELADLMMIAGERVETLICRIAQLARAAGIHLVAATQRPSVDVVTGLIKANIPARVAFAVPGHPDSVTILGQGGAEKLLGHGDALWLPAGAGVPTRVQGAYIPDGEVGRLVQHWRDQVAAGLAVPPMDVRAARPTAADQTAEAADGSADRRELAAEALAAIHTWAEAHADRLATGIIKGDPIADGKLGHRRQDGSLALLPDPVKTELAGLGFDPDLVIRAWTETGVASRGEGNNRLPKVWFGPVQRTSRRMVVLPAPPDHPDSGGR